MNEILRIQGQEVDLIPKSIDRTIQINDLGSAESRESSYSQTISLPKTSRNQMVLEFLGVSGNTSKAPYKQLSADYIVDGIPLVINGYAEVKATKNHYEVVIYDGVIDLAEKLKGKTLSSLNYSDLNHFSGSDTFIQSFENTSGYIYALGDFGLGLGGIKTERTVPSIFTHTIWDKVFSQLGVNYFGNFFSQNEDFRTEVVTPPQGFEVENLQPTETVINNYSTTVVYHSEQSQDYIFSTFNRFGFDTTFGDSRISFGSNGVITFTASGRFKVIADVYYTSVAGYNQVQIFLNSGAVKSVYLDPNQEYKQVELNLSVQEGDELYLGVSGTNTGFDSPQVTEGGQTTVDNYYAVEYQAWSSVTFSELTGGSMIDFNQMMGDLPLIEFVKDVMQRYGLVIKPVKGSRDYEFIQFENLLNDRDNADDWTENLDEIQGEQYGINYAKENIATYNYAEGIEVPSHDGILTIENENAEPSKPLFKSPYTIPTVGRTFAGIPLYLHPVWEWKEEDGVNLIKVKEAPIKTFRIKKYNQNITILSFDDSNGVNYTGDVPYLSLENMSMQYYLNVYYKAYRFAINTFKEVDATFYFNLLEIHNLDLFKLKYLNQTGKFYYLNELQHNAGGEVSKGKLIEINEFSYNLPVQTLGSYTYNMNYGTTRILSMLYLTSYTTPKFSDPENDSPKAVKFISGFNPNIKLYQAGVEITDDTEILVSDWDVTIVDMETTTDAHQETFEYMIKDAGSDSYGTQVGTFNVSVYQYTNSAPRANAGSDAVKMIYTNVGFPAYQELNASDSSDSSGTIVSYDWVILSKPFNSGATISNSNTTQPLADLVLPQEEDSVGTYTIQLTVTDDFGLQDTDTVQITVQIEEGIENQ